MIVISSERPKVSPFILPLGDVRSVFFLQAVEVFLVKASAYHAMGVLCRLSDIERKNLFLLKRES